MILLMISQISSVNLELEGKVRDLEQALNKPQIKIKEDKLEEEAWQWNQVVVVEDSIGAS